MTMTQWAEKEVAAACKKENPDWDGKSFDYGCSCYQSALKAYKSMMEDGHSGYSFSVTKNILNRLLDEIPLSPITDEDFFSVERGTEEFPCEPEEFLRDAGLKSCLQCPRRFSLFRREDLEGNVTYRDNDRYYCINTENPSDTFSSGIADFIDKLYPITMPYMPESKPYKVYVKSWLTDKKHGDFDVHVITGYETPKGEYIPYEYWEYYGDNGTEIITDPGRKQELINARIDKPEKKIASYILNNIIDIYGTDKIWEEDKHRYDEIRNICEEVFDRYADDIMKECWGFNIPDEKGICKYSTWHNCRIFTSQDKEAAGKFIDSVDNTMAKESFRKLYDLITKIHENIIEKI